MWPDLQFSADLVTFTEEVFNGKFHFLCSARTFFRNSFFSSTIIEWKNIDQKEETKPFPMFTDTAVSQKLSVFWELSDHLLPNGVFNSHNPKRIRFITRLPLGLSHLQNRKFRHIFQDLLHKMCNSLLDVEATSHYLFHWLTHSHNTERYVLWSPIRIVIQ